MSKLRACWYTIEVASRLSTHAQSGVVVLCSGRSCSLWEFDKELTQKYFYFESNCWPIKHEALHFFDTPIIIARMVIPIFCALQSKQSRVRTIFHEGSEEENLAALSEYGITASMLPECCGGTVLLDQKEWIAQQIALEMKELELA